MERLFVASDVRDITMIMKHLRKLIKDAEDEVNYSLKRREPERAEEYQEVVEYLEADYAIYTRLLEGPRNVSTDNPLFLIKHSYYLREVFNI